MSSYKSENTILILTFEFAKSVMTYCDQLENIKRYNMAKQLWRSGTAIGALVQEAQNAESLADFVHKMKIAGKEADETIYWVRLCKESSGYPNTDLLEEKITVINKIINKIISSTKSKFKQ